MSRRPSGTVFLRHHRVDLAVHTLRDSNGPRLLLLHGLGERAPATLPGELEPWPGAVFALDFTGHGDSSVPHAGGYTAEALMGDADTALAHLGPCTVVGRGLGGYVALLIAGGRPQLVRGAVICDGPGFVGGPQHGPPILAYPVAERVAGSAPDPNVLVELSSDVRPADYAAAYARFAVEGSDLEWPVTVACVARPEWLLAVLNEYGVRTAPLSEALAAYAGR